MHAIQIINSDNFTLSKNNIIFKLPTVSSALRLSPNDLPRI